MPDRSRAVAPALLLCLVAAPALAACGSDDSLPASKAATDADRAGVLTTGSADPTTTTTASAATTPSSSPTPSATPRTPDGVTYALLTTASTTSLTYDKIDYQRAACDALAPKQPVAPAVGFKACFTNVNPLKRTVAVSPSVRVSVIQEGDPPRTIPIASLESFLSSSDNTEPRAYSAFKVTVAGGRVTAIDQFGVSYA